MAPDAANERNRHLHRLGNLTLVTQPLNSSVSNGPWPLKQEALDNHSVLYLNRPLVNYSDSWSEEAINARSATLARHLKSAWPGPESEAW
ncbi:hypothetical protein BH20ACT23_BH20ACT23_31240 [soil metagenome]